MPLSERHERNLVFQGAGARRAETILGKAATAATIGFVGFLGACAVSTKPFPKRAAVGAMLCLAAKMEAQTRATYYRSERSQMATLWNLHCNESPCTGAQMNWLLYVFPENVNSED